MAPQRLHGSRGMILMSTTGTGVPVKTHGLNKWNIDMSTDKVDVTAFGDRTKQYVQGLPDIKGSISGFWETEGDLLFPASLSPDGIQLLLYPSELFPGSYLYGPALIDAKMNVDSGGAVEISGDFVGKGDWGWVGGI